MQKIEIQKTDKFNIGTARTQVPTTTNYDVGSTTWVDLRLVPFQSAMKVTNLGHRSSCSPIGPVQHLVNFSHSSSLDVGLQCQTYCLLPYVLDVGLEYFI
ncbi:hypothetical protein AHAS_Ahas13G0236500 [Arachis hypogaea]